MTVKLISEKEQNVGLFNELAPTSDGAYAPVIKDLTFYGAEVYGRNVSHRGLIAGKATGATLSNIIVDGLSVLEYKPYFSSDVNLASSGGLIGYTENSLISRVQVKDADIGMNAYGGGILGIAANGTIIEKSSVINLESRAERCFSKDKQCGFGGLIGRAGGGDEGSAQPVIISESSAQGLIDTDRSIGGLVGFIERQQAVNILNSYAQVRLAINCAEPITGSTCKYAGGLIGRTDKSGSDDSAPVLLQNVYAAGKVKLDAARHGRAIVGNDAQQGADRVIGEQSYFDIDVTEKNNSGDSISIGLRTAQMQDPLNENFATWDREIWQFSESGDDYPRLK